MDARSHSRGRATPWCFSLLSRKIWS